ncbi:YheC/YheD family protein [Candidatus Contubernalis alkaliaceticus]|uniref:YheC/YheD family protein n=1 Tax=Candidatus Contubernalis alkaliaceticus TaxID=338645 RepID=UPI001F4C1A33|nr:YheC/YheD family protein [Candidatus Contubernalis alkalaceticus]UNC91181.1 YheC/YheD family protein [Candidatus Contubernalis alkalaceticus]
MIGIVLSPTSFNREIKRLNKEHNILNQYKILAKKYQVDLCMFSFKQISKNLKMIDAFFYSWKQDNLIRKTLALPRINIVYNTSYIANQEQINNFEKLHNQNIYFINLPLKFQANKLRNYEYIQSHNQLKDHVPPAKPLSFKRLESFIRQYDKVIIKPIYGKKGRGMTIIEKDQIQYKVCQTPLGKKNFTNSRLNSNQKKLSISHSQLKGFYNKNFGKPKSFLVQQWIPFKEFKGRPFDIRAVVQKNGKNKWQLTSRVARVAKEPGQITNLSQGGEMVSFSKMQLKKHYRDIREFCLEIAKTMAKVYPWTAEMGIDLAIDKNGKLWYIETNFCPEKIRWVTTFKIPFEHAYYLYTEKVLGD